MRRGLTAGAGRAGAARARPARATAAPPPRAAPPAPPRAAAHHRHMHTIYTERWTRASKASTERFSSRNKFIFYLCTGRM